MPFLQILKNGEPGLESAATMFVEAASSDEEKVSNLAFVALENIYEEMAKDKTLRDALYNCVLRVSRVRQNVTFV